MSLFLLFGLTATMTEIYRGVNFSFASILMSNDVASSTVKVENKTVINQNKVVLFCFKSCVFI